MKKKKGFSLLVIACSAAFLYSCSGSMNPSKIFVRKWQMQSFKSKAFDDHIAMIKQTLDTTKDSTLKAYLQKQLDQVGVMMSSMKKTMLTSNVDGTCEIDAPNPMTGQMAVTKGKWLLIEGGKKLVMTENQNPRPDTLNIEKLTSDTLVFSIPDGKGGKVIQTYSSVQ